MPTQGSADNFLSTNVQVKNFGPLQYNRLYLYFSLFKALKMVLFSVQCYPLSESTALYEGYQRMPSCPSDRSIVMIK